MCERATPILKRILFVKLSAFLSLQLHVKSSSVSGLRILIQILEAWARQNFAKKKVIIPWLRREFATQQKEILDAIFAQEITE